MSFLNPYDDSTISYVSNLTKCLNYEQSTMYHFSIKLIKSIDKAILNHGEWRGLTRISIFEFERTRMS